MFPELHSELSTDIPPYDVLSRARMAVRLVERIMTQHGDIRCCRCWFCLAARDLGCQVRPEFVGAEPFAPLSTPVAR